MASPGYFHTQSIEEFDMSNDPRVCSEACRVAMSFMQVTAANAWDSKDVELSGVCKLPSQPSACINRCASKMVGADFIRTQFSHDRHPRTSPSTPRAWLEVFTSFLS